MKHLVELCDQPKVLLVVAIKTKLKFIDGKKINSAKD